MADLVAFLRVRLDEETEVAKRAAFGWGADWDALDRGEDGAYLTAVGSPRAAWSEDHDVIRHAAYWDPARVLAEVAAKRAIVDIYEKERGEAADRLRCGGMPGYGGKLIEGCLLALAQPFAEHPNFDPSWRLEVADHG